MGNPLVTIVTPCYNSAKFVVETVQSVLQQSYSPIEYIVVDGSSTDGTVELLRTFVPRLRLISEPDKGQADAINKGWRLAKGDILGWLNADDVYLPDTVQKAVEFIGSHLEVDWVYGYSKMQDENGKPRPFRHPVAKWNYARLLNEGCYIIQPSVFIRRKIIEEYGYLREDLQYGLDYEYWLRIGRKYPGYLVPSIWTAVKWYRENKSLGGGVKRINEIKKIVQEYGARDLPRKMRFEWAEAYFGSVLQQLKAGSPGQATADFLAAFRYPLAVPRGLVKLAIRLILPGSVETALRQRIMRGGDIPKNA